MLVASIQHLQYRYLQQNTELLTDINLTIQHDSKIGLVGDNGCGKSTLFALLRAQLLPEAGKIEFVNCQHIGYLPQEIKVEPSLTAEQYLWSTQPQLCMLKQQIDCFDAEKNLEDINAFDEFYQLGGYEFEAKIKAKLLQFNFCETALVRQISSFSGGEQTKIALCGLLLNKPDLLLLDEPSNHLDQSTLAWLESYLVSLTIPYIVISHDRAFLNNTATEIITISQGKSTHYAGNFDFYQQQRQLQQQQQLELYHKQQKKLKQLHEAAVEREQWSTIKQKHTRSVANNGRICKRDDGSLPASKGRLTRQVSAVRVRMQRTIEHEKAYKPFIKKQRQLMTVVPEKISNHCVLQIKNVSKHYTAHCLFKQLSFTVERGSRLAIIGDNGCGKTTLLRLLSGELASDSGSIYWPPQVRLAYYDQMALNLQVKLSALDNCAQYCDDQGLIRTTLGQLFFPKNALQQPVDCLSQGERAKLALSILLLQQANVLLLDEPCNHLELNAREALETALMNFPGTIIFVSHDRYFREKLATEELWL